MVQPDEILDADEELDMAEEVKPSLVEPDVGEQPTDYMGDEITEPAIKDN